jgi:hypothetical protein
MTAFTTAVPARQHQLWAEKNKIGAPSFHFGITCLPSGLDD